MGYEHIARLGRAVHRRGLEGSDISIGASCGVRTGAQQLLAQLRTVPATGEIQCAVESSSAVDEHADNLGGDLYLFRDTPLQQRVAIPRSSVISGSVSIAALSPVASPLNNAWSAGVILSSSASTITPVSHGANGVGCCYRKTIRSNPSDGLGGEIQRTLRSGPKRPTHSRRSGGRPDNSCKCARP